MPDRFYVSQDTNGFAVFDSRARIDPELGAVAPIVEYVRRTSTFSEARERAQAVADALNQRDSAGTAPA